MNCMKKQKLYVAYFLSLFLIFLLIRASYAKDVTLNFKDADISAVIEMVSKITEKNFIVDPRVKGKVTMISAHPVDKDTVYKTFLSVLKVYGYVAIPSGSAIKILPETEAKDTASDKSYVSGGEDEVVFEVINIDNVDAKQLVSVIRPFISKNGYITTHDTSNTLIVSATKGDIKRIKRIIEKIDVSGKLDIEPVKLDYASATECVNMILSLYKTKTSEKPLNIFADERTNTVFISGTEEQRLNLRAMLGYLDIPLDKDNNTHVIYLKYAKAADLKPILEGIIDNKQKNKVSEVVILSDESTNALIIKANSDDFKKIKSIIEKLDIRRAQVLVEAIIVEINDEKAKKMGIKWFAANPNFINLADSALASAASLDIGSFIGKLSAGTEVDFGGVLKMIMNDASANVISTPSLITMDNEEAVMSVGREVPFTTGSYTITEGASASNPFQTIQRENVGLTLKIKPQINEGTAIKLEIDQEISSLLPNASSTLGDTYKMTSVRSIKTKVIVDDNGILVLGGLIDDVSNDSVTKLPVLGSIPILRGFFRYKETTKEKRNLMIFIHPQIIRDEAMSSAVTYSKYNMLRNLQLEEAKKNSVPVLKNLNELRQKKLDWVIDLYNNMNK